jgi:threonine/homoserine/homoserine lactone efflux protein
VLIQAIGDFLPAAVAVALSPIPIVAIVLVLGTSHARSNGSLFALGWVAGLTAVSVLVVVVLGGASDPNDGSAAVADWLKVALGAMFLVMAARQWRKRPKGGDEPVTPKWMAGLDTLTPPKALLLGVTLSAANPKNLALTLTAAASIAQAGLDGADTAIAIAVFVAIGSVSVAGAVLYYLADATRAAGPLARLQAFMLEHNAVIMMVLLLVMGTKILGDGVAALLT